jgi:hypothetical protein
MVDVETLGPTVDQTLNGPVTMLNRMRLACTPLAADGTRLACPKAGMYTGCETTLSGHELGSSAQCIDFRSSADIAVADAGWQVMNEVTLHRGRNTHLTIVDAYFDGQHLTEAVVSGVPIFPSRLVAKLWYRAEAFRRTASCYLLPLDRLPTRSPPEDQSLIPRPMRFYSLPSPRGH